MASVAYKISEAIVLTIVQRIEGELVLETNCTDYDHYKTLPEVVAYDGILCGKTGWSSDRNYACYKSGVKIARAVST